MRYNIYVIFDNGENKTYLQCSEYRLTTDGWLRFNQGSKSTYIPLNRLLQFSFEEVK